VQRLIASLADGDVAGLSWELVIVDNGSTDDTPLVCRSAAAGFRDGMLRYVMEPTPGLHAGRHRGAREAAADVVAYLDDDVEVSATWLRAFTESFSDPGIEIVGGPIMPRYEIASPPWVASTWKTQPDGTTWCGYLSLLESGDAPHEIDPLFVWGGNMAIRRSTLFRLRGFHPDGMPWELRRYRGDGETGLSLKAIKAGVHAWHCPEALVYHDVSAERLTKDYFARRTFLQGVSDSFTAVRAQGGPAPLSRRSLAGRARSWARRSIDGRSRRERHSPDARLQARLRAAHDDGYQFHQREIASDPALLAWVLREDFLDDAIPGTDHPD
jgi:glycosyltransferase involved in cell wall biosynthesis